MIDLHTHSVFSDGSLTPAQLAQAAREASLSAIALTDHDTTAGMPEFVTACREVGVQGIAGVEISAEFSPGTLHMLGFFIEPACAELQRGLESLRDGRQERNRQMLERLNGMGCALTWEEIAKQAGGDVVGRAHFALALIARGLVKSKDDAFDRFLAKGKPGYVNRFRLSPADSIRLIRQAGGVPVLAHPCTLKLKQKALHTLVAELTGHGLAGIETYYSEHSPEQHRLFNRLAAEFGLALSGGSDFHGAVNPDIALGRGFGNLKVPDELVAKLHARRTAERK